MCRKPAGSAPGGWIRAVPWTQALPPGWVASPSMKGRGAGLLNCCDRFAPQAFLIVRLNPGKSVHPELERRQPELLQAQGERDEGRSCPRSWSGIPTPAALPLVARPVSHSVPPPSHLRAANPPNFPPQNPLPSRPPFLYNNHIFPSLNPGVKSHIRSR